MDLLILHKWFSDKNEVLLLSLSIYFFFCCMLVDFIGNAMIQHIHVYDKQSQK